MKQKDIFLLLIPFCLVVVIYIILSIYHSVTTSTIPQTLNVQINPISPEFNEKTIMDIKKREKVVPIFEAGAPVSTQGALIR